MSKLVLERRAKSQARAKPPHKDSLARPKAASAPEWRLAGAALPRRQASLDEETALSPGLRRTAPFSSAMVTTRSSSTSAA